MLNGQSQGQVHLELSPALSPIPSDLTEKNRSTKKSSENVKTNNNQVAVEEVDDLEEEIELDIDLDDEQDVNVASDETANDPISLYLEEISRISLLSKEKEVELAKKIEAGDLANERIKSENLSYVERTELRPVIVAGDRARDELIEANYRLVISITKKYASRGVAFMDLI